MKGKKRRKREKKHLKRVKGGEWQRSERFEPIFGSRVTKSGAVTIAFPEDGGDV